MGEVKKFNGWMIASGIVMLIVGFLCIFWSNESLSTLAVLVGIGFLFAGVANIISYVSYKDLVIYPGWIILDIVIDILLGLMFVIHPFIAATVIAWLVGVTVVIAAMIQFVGAINSHAAGLPDWWVGLIGGIFSLILAILMFVYPGLLAIMIGIYAVAAGCLLISTGSMFSRAFR